MTKNYLGAAFFFLYCGCGIVPGGGRLYSDYEKTAHYTLSGASKFSVKSDWGTPDQVYETETGETWVYGNRQDGKTFQFHFDRRGALVSSRIDKPVR